MLEVKQGPLRSPSCPLTGAWARYSLGWICWFNSRDLAGGAVALMFWVILTALAAALLRRVIVHSFDHLLGRMPENPTRPACPPPHKSPSRRAVGSLTD
jgi:hypothetical protein